MESDSVASKAGWVARAGRLIVLLGPLVVVVAVWQRLAGNDRVIAAVLGLAGEGALAVAGFAGKVVGELAALWRKRLVDHVDEALSRRVSRFDRRYRNFVLAGLRFIDLKGLATVGSFTPELDEVFVDVSLAFRAPHQVPADLLADLSTDITERQSLSGLLDRQQPVVLAIIGAPGSGKTTLLRQTARQVCLARRGRRRSVPILLYLRDHVAAIVAADDVTLADLLRSTLGPSGEREPTNWFEQHLQDGVCVVLLDGLDEVARQEDRRKVSSWVERQIQQYPKNDYVITSRPHGYRMASIDGAVVLQACGFTTEQVTRFVRGWYLAVERHSTGVGGDDIAVRATAGADDLLQRLKDSPGLYDLTVNPLLLTMIANVHRYRGALPGSRVELYDEICQVMLWRRQEAKKLAAELSGGKKEVLLRGLAYTMMDRRLRDISREDVLAEIKRALRRVSKKVTAEEFLADVSSNGLLIERESELYSFAHQTFQEYLASAYIREKGLVNVLSKAVDDVWWRETTVLYAARADADPIVKACLSSASITALALAFDCADQGSELAPELRDRLDDLLATATTPGTDPERRRLITGVLLTRHLQQQIRTAADGHVCARPITSALYDLFRQDTKLPAQDQTGGEVACGMRSADASSFVGWVNGIIGGERTYRLVSRTEIDDPAVQRILAVPAVTGSARSIWLASDIAHPAVWLWIPAGMWHPYTIDIETLTAHVERDMVRSVATLTRLLLMWSVVTASVIERNLGYSVMAAACVAGDSDRTRAVATAKALDRALADALDLDSAVTVDFPSALNLARTLDDVDVRRLVDEFAVARGRGSVRELTRARELARTLDGALARSRDLARSLTKAGALEDIRASTRAKAFASANALARGHTDVDPDVEADPWGRDLDWALDLDRGRSLRLDQNRGFVPDDDRNMGKALALALSRSLPEAADTSGWPAAFPRAFAETTGIAMGTYVASPDALTDKLSTALHGLEGSWSISVETASSSWMVNVAHRLQETAAPVFDRREHLTPDIATSIRLAALCLAAEFDAEGQQQLGTTLREIAAGVTLLECRANGDAPVTETILLAVE